MTEIHVEKKAAVWPWIVGLLLLVLVAWVAFGMLNDDDRAAEQAVIVPPVDRAVDPRTNDALPAGRNDALPAGTNDALSQPVQEYLSFARGTTELAPGLDHEYTAEGIRRLTEALGAHVGQNPDNAEMRARFERFRELAGRVQKDPQSTGHANAVRAVFTSAADVFESARIEAGDVSGLRQTASSIEADQPLLEQTDRVRQFFRQSADALERAARQS